MDIRIIKKAEYFFHLIIVHIVSLISGRISSSEVSPLANISRAESFNVLIL